MTNPQTNSSAPVGNPPLTPPFGRKAKRVRAKLRSVQDTAALLATIIREARSGITSTEDMSRFANALSILAKLIEGGDMAARLDALERAAASRMGRASVQ